MLFTYSQIDSTNRLAKEFATEGKPAGTVVHAISQTSGRGQYGRNFTSPKGGLYFSLLLEPSISPEKLPLITLATGLACRDVLHQTFHLLPKIKWPNDIYLNGKKVAGILCEAVLLTHHPTTKAKVVVGVGMNVNSVKNDFPIEIQPIITTLYDELQFVIELDRLRDQLLETIIRYSARLQSDIAHILSEWQRYDFLFDQSVVCINGDQTIEGLGRGIDAQGFYHVQDKYGVDHRLLGGGQLRLHK